MEVYAVICSDGAITNRDDVKQCQHERWMPIATITQDGKVTVLLFYDYKIAAQFIKRNYPSDWTRGIISLTTDELKWMQDQGWGNKILSYPQRLKDTPGFGYEVLQFQSDMDIKIRG